MERLARWCVRRRWLVLVAWLVALGVTTALAGQPSYSRAIDTPGESQRAFALLQARFGAAEAGDSIEVVVKADAGVHDPAVRQRVTDLLQRADALPHVEEVSSPYAQGGRQQVAPDGTVAYATLRLDARGFDVPNSLVEDLERLRDQARAPGLQVELGGQPVRNAETSTGNAAELVGFLAALAILLLVFGSLVAAGLPLLTALAGVGLAASMIGLLTRAIDIPEFAPQLAAMIGIGVGVDYALFVVTRYRHALAGGTQPADAAVIAMATAGRAVLVAGATVVLSLLGVLVIGQQALLGLGVAAAVTVLATMLAAITLLPALLGIAGRRIDRLSWRRRRSVTGTAGQGGADGQGWTFRWVAGVQRHPATWAAISLLLLAVLIVPVASLRLGTADARNGSTDATSRKAYQLLAEGFGPGFNGPLLLVADLTNVPGGTGGPAGRAMLARLRTGVAGDPGVAAVSPPRPNPAGDAAVLTALARSAPQDRATDQLVRRLRAEVIPPAVGGTGAHAWVGGLVAANIDFATQISQRLPWLFAVVIGPSLVLLLVGFRSLLLPVKAAVLNLLSIAAAYGALVAVFQWGWGIGVLGVAEGAPIDPVMPMLMFAIAFGLSMDYEVFLLSRVREEWARTGDTRLAVARGVGATAGVITAAAAIMIAVFAAFMLGSERLLKLFGFGLAIPILLDVLLIRLLLVPAAMQLLGRANWYLPPWLDRLLPSSPVADGRRAPAAQAPA
jgi:putative drug exporter of the RND superfamily